MHFIRNVLGSAWIDYVSPSSCFLVRLISKPDLIHRFAPVEHSTHTNICICTKLCSTHIWVRDKTEREHRIGMNWSIYYCTASKLINWYHICNRFVWAYVTHKYVLWLRLAPAMHFKVCLCFYQFLRLMSFWCRRLICFISGTKTNRTATHLSITRALHKQISCCITNVW